MGFELRHALVAWGVAALGACSTVSESPPESRTGVAVSAFASAPVIVLNLPRAASFAQSAIIVKDSLDIDDDAVVRHGSGGFGHLANTGGHDTTIGKRAQVGTVRSTSRIVLRENSLVSGDVVTESDIQKKSGAQVSGQQLAGTSVHPFLTVSWTAEIPLGTASEIRVSSGVRTLAPGAFGRVSVANGAHLVLQAGTYTFDRLEIESGATLQVNHQRQPVFVYVSDKLVHKGTIDDAGDASNLLLATMQTATLQVDGALRGTLIAPSAQVKLSGAPTPAHLATVFADKATLDKGAVLNHQLFAHWGTLFPPTPLVECVTAFNAAAYNVLYSYENLLDFDVIVPTGAKDRFEPTSDAVPPTLFKPGRVTGVVAVPLGTSSQGWRLGSTVASATRSTMPRCTGSEYRNVPPQLVTLPNEPHDWDRPGRPDPDALARMLAP